MSFVYNSFLFVVKRHGQFIGVVRYRNTLIIIIIIIIIIVYFLAAVFKAIVSSYFRLSDTPKNL